MVKMDELKGVCTVSAVPVRRVLVSTLHPLGGNYGGLLQAYAMQQVLTGLGFDVRTINSSQEYGDLQLYARRGVKWLLRAIGRSKGRGPISARQARFEWQYAYEFMEENLPTVALFEVSTREREAFMRDLHGIVVGSDQVWRRAYAKVPEQLLSFVHDDNVRRISYAASFGVDHLEGYSRRLRMRSSQLARKFDAISVRETSGVEICRQEWNISADTHVDPTLLIPKETWASLAYARTSDVCDPKGDLFQYVLDPSARVTSIVRDVASAHGLLPFSLEGVDFSRGGRHVRRRPVEEWLRAFMGSKFVVTDSFHGTVFAIIFNVPFVVVGNHARGMSRFESLLKVFGLSDRLVRPGDSVEGPSLLWVDWDPVNDRIQTERGRALKYLRDALS